MKSNDRSDKNRIAVYAGLTVACLAVLTLILFGIVRLMRSAKSDADDQRTRELMESNEDHPIATIGHETIEELEAGRTKDPETTPEILPTETPEPEMPVVTEKMAGIISAWNNEDIVGWLHIQNSQSDQNMNGISYAVTQTDKPGTGGEIGEYYLKRGLDGEYSDRGSLFLDYRANSGVGVRENGYWGGNAPSDILLIYGHNMGDESMFGTLKRYLNTEFAWNHRFIEYDSLYEHRIYQVISVFRSNVMTSAEVMDYSDPKDPNFKYYQFTNYLTEGEFDYWYANVMSHSEVNLQKYESIEAHYGDEFLVLSTCHGPINGTGLLCVVAVRVER
ncbi:MAG: class B sortase [Lachnospiraceae bacterium]|nr:class B sortase [Lachnospiraceae bacterium]